ncbi:Integrase catalytic domain-containing protein [Aphis craccivora]|uniref:Integrase catalytic domain-containing protein n=1 Tax=Aphis craccivora TaxID=307492 RepID=A0A6G0W3J8_APHCR|nr:Integrase catalytic domain-containing protein [Aphis craccivora]
MSTHNADENLLEMSNADLVSTLVRRRGQIKASLTRHSTFVNKYIESPNAISEAESRLNVIPTLLNQFEDIQSRIEEIDDGNDDAHLAAREDFETRYFSVAGQLNRLIQPTKFAMANSGNSIDTKQQKASAQQWEELLRRSEGSTLRSRSSLPPLPLESFEGDYNSWPRFYSSFVSRVENEKGVSNADKFHYLRSCLKGVPLDLVDALEINDFTYTTAIKCLKSRYERKRLITEAHVRSLLELPKLTGSSASDLRGFLANITKHIEALRSLKRPVDQWDDLLIGIARSKLDLRTLEQWDLSIGVTEEVNFNKLTEFLERRASSLESFEGQNSSICNKRKGYRTNEKGASVLSAQGSRTVCCLCSQPHMLFFCHKFKAMHLTERYNTVKMHRLCFNCLSPAHSASSCTQSGCRNCKYKHNTLLHGLPYQKKADPLGTNKSRTAEHDHSKSPSIQGSLEVNDAKAASEPPATVNLAALHSHSNAEQVLLSTAIVFVLDRNGTKRPCRAIVDNGSQINIITKSLVKRLRLKGVQSKLPISGVNGASTISSEEAEVTIFSQNSQFSAKIGCHTLHEITNALPSQSMDFSSWSIPPHILPHLADPKFYLSSKVELLLGADIFFEVLQGEKWSLGKELPWLYNTSFGWIVSGSIGNTKSRISPRSSSCLLNVASWMKNDQVKSRRNVDEASEIMFRETHERDTTGRFSVYLPFTADVRELGSSFQMALKRFTNLEKKFSVAPHLKDDYVNFMNEYASLGHMSKIDDPISDAPYYYLPHHAVIKETSQTTKVRVVFDASAKTSKGNSLNDVLAQGPAIQSELFDIVLRFRCHKIVITADIEKMFRQVWVNHEDRDYQRILWRDSPEKEIIHYRLNTITYGTAPAAFLATRVLKEIGLLAAQDKPSAGRAIQRDFYMDDFLSGGDTVEEVVRLYHEVLELLESSGMRLRKWCSSAPEVRAEIATTSSEPHYSLDLGDDDTVKSLGLIWCPESDILKFKVRNANDTRVQTKRDLLSSLNSVFDPLGFLGPTLIRGKIFLQELWQIKLGWDDTLSEDFQMRWRRFLDDLATAHQISIPRAIKVGLSKEVELHGFSDASQSAYGACIYFKQASEHGKWSVRLLCAKSRVAPMKSLTIPRLELSGAHLLAELISRVSSSLEISNDKVFCWCDSTVVLAWIKGGAAQWNTFVSNRVAQIIELTGENSWRYVSTSVNPADQLSRGINTADLATSELWWNGPSFLKEDKALWPQVRHDPRCSEEAPEKRTIKFTLNTIAAKNELMHRYSSWSKLLRISAIWIRFFQWRKWQKDPACTKPQVGPLTVAEIQRSKERWIRITQRQAFPEEINALRNKKQVTRGPIRMLSPYLDNDLLKVGGRLENSNISASRKHPVILPRQHVVTEMICREYHQRYMHVGPQGLLAAVRGEFWVLRGRDVARATVYKCLKCFRARPSSLQPAMGQLPSARVTPSRAFAQTGVDFAGPLLIKLGLRKSTTIKAYVAVFVCFATKAIHLEAVSALTTAAFMAALKRFMSRRGKPSRIWSDNGTNFVGTRKELECYFRRQLTGRTISDELVEEGVQWVFTPPAAPHFGGVWEAAVKSFKHHFVRVAGAAILNFEELATLLAQIEACLNSRPLTAVSSDPADLQALTPGHFLIGGPVLMLPETDYSEMPDNRLKRWELVQKMTQMFWKRWRLEYLSSLQSKAKWLNSTTNVKIGTLAVLKDDNVPPLQWKMVRIIEIHPGSDGIVRVVTVRTASGQQLKRPTVKICPLPMGKEE